MTTPRQRWLVEEENFRSVGERAGDRYALSLSSGEIAHVSVLIPRQTDALKESSNLLCGRTLPALTRPVGDVLGHGSGKEIRRLHHHADAAPQLLWRQLSVVLTIEPYSTACRLVEPVQQAKEGRLPRSAGSGYGKNFADMNLDADIIGYDFPDDGAQQMLGFERRGRHWRTFVRRLRFHR